jgi:hypothetical protein
MKIGDEILIKAKVIGLDSESGTTSVKVEVEGYVSMLEKNAPFEEPITFWISDHLKEIVVK